MSLTEQSVREVVSAILEPEIGKTLGELGMVHGVELDGAAVALKIVLMTPAYLPKEMLEEHVVKAVQRLGASKVEVAWDYAMTTRVIQPDDPCPEVSNIVRSQFKRHISCSSSPSLRSTPETSPGRLQSLAPRTSDA